MYNMNGNMYNIIVNVYSGTKSCIWKRVKIVKNNL